MENMNTASKDKNLEKIRRLVPNKRVSWLLQEDCTSIKCTHEPGPKHHQALAPSDRTPSPTIVTPPYRARLRLRHHQANMPKKPT